MNSIAQDSGDEIAKTATTSTTGSDPSKGSDISKDAATDQQKRSEQDAAQRRRAAEGADAAEQGRAREVGSSTLADTWHGGGGADRRLLVIALDGATPELALGAWRTQLRTIELLTERGLRGRLRSSTPWASLPAWLSLFSGLDPGQLGVYAPAQRPNRSYAAPIRVDSRAVRASRVWETLGRAGKRVAVLAVPATSPVAPINGQIIGDQADTAPASFQRQVELWRSDEPASQPAGGDDLDRIIGNAYSQAEQRFRLARRMLARTSYDCFVLYDSGIATVQRALWHALDVTHLRYRPGHPFATAISAFYQFIDEQIGDLLELVDDQTIVAVVSACGAQALDGELALNDWLIDQGELRLLAAPARPTPLAECAVDWAGTRAWAADNGTIYLNLAGREPHGAVPADQAAALLASLAARLQALRLPTGARADAPAFDARRPAELYSTVSGIAPDLLLIGREPGWRTSAIVGQRNTWLTAQADALDSACDSPDGMFVLYDPQQPGGGRELDGATIYDIVPTLLALFDVRPGPHARGQVLTTRAL